MIELWDFWMQPSKYDARAHRYIYYLHFKYRGEEFFMNKPLSPLITDEEQIYEVVAREDELNRYLSEFHERGVEARYKFKGYNILWQEDHVDKKYGHVYEVKHYAAMKVI